MNLQGKRVFELLATYPPTATVGEFLAAKLPWVSFSPQVPLYFLTWTED